MSDFWDYRGWERHEENNDWQDIQGDNLEYRADALMNRAIRNGLDSDSLDKTISYLSAAADLNRDLERIPELLQCLLMLGDCFLKQEKADDLAEVSTEAQRVALSSFNDAARAKAIHLQGYQHYVAKRFSKAAEFSMNAGHLYESAFELDDAYSVYVSAAKLYRWRGERFSSISAFEEALRVARAADNLEQIVESKSWIAFLQLRVSPIIDLEVAKKNLDLIADQLKIAKGKNSTWRRHDSATSWLKVKTNPTEAVKNFDLLLDIARNDKHTIDSTEMMLGRAYALREVENGELYVQALRSVLATIEDVDSTVAILEVVEPLADYYLANERFIEAELIWVRARELAEKRGEDSDLLTYIDQMISLCIAEYAEPVRALTALESTLPKTIESPLPFDYEYALAKAYAANDRRTESLIVIDRALEAMSDIESSKLEYAELHELKCELLAKEGNLPAAKNEARLSFEAYFDLNRMDKAKRLKTAYLQPQPGDAHPETGAITIANWE